VVEAEPFRQPGDLPGHVGKGQPGYDRGDRAQRRDLALGEDQPPLPLGEQGIDDQVGQRAGAAGERLGEDGGTFVAQDLGWVLPGREGRRADPAGV
jgi:hypothetical protein